MYGDCLGENIVKKIVWTFSWKLECIIKLNHIDTRAQNQQHANTDKKIKNY